MNGSRLANRDWLFDALIDWLTPWLILNLCYSITSVFTEFYVKITIYVLDGTVEMAENMSEIVIPTCSYRMGVQVDYEDLKRMIYSFVIIRIIWLIFESLLRRWV